MLTAEQITARRDGLGGSDLAWMLGFYQTYLHDDGQPKTAKTLWETKMGMRQADAGNADTERGHDREPRIRCAVAELLGETVCEHPATIYHADYPWMLCHVDGLIGKYAPYGVLEIKRPKFYTKLKEAWQVQLQWNMLVSDCTWGRLAYEYGTKDGSTVLTISPRIDRRDDALCTQLTELTRRFWRCVECGEYKENWNHGA